MSALHYLLLSTILFSSISSSNLECVLESLNSFRRVNKPAPSSPAFNKLKSNVIHDGISKITTFFKGFIDTNKDKNGKFQPMTNEAVIEEFIAKNSPVLKDQQRRLCDQICVPSISEMDIDRSVAVYFCERIITTKSDMIKFFLDNFDVAATYFGHGFQASSVRLPASFFSSNSKQSESMVNSFQEKQKLILSLKKDLDDITTLMNEELEKFFKINIQQTLINNFKKNLDLEKTVKTLVAKDNKNLKEKVTKLTIAFNTNLDGKKADQVKSFKSALSTYSSVVKEDVSSQAFQSLLDKAIVLAEPNYPTHSIQVDNYILAHCFEALSKFGVNQPVHSCRSIIQPALEVDSSIKSLFDYALESPKFFKMINHFVQKNLMVFASNKLANIHSVSSLIKKDITEQLMKIHYHLETIERMYPAANAEIFAPLIWDLMKFVSRFNKEAFEILRVTGALELYHKELLTNVHSSPKVYELVSGFKKSLYAHFKTDKHDMHAAEFRDGLTEECERQLTDTKLKICKKSVQAFDVDKKLAMIRHSNAVFRYIITLLKQSLDKLDMQMNEEITLVSAAIDTIKNIIKSIDENFESLSKNLSGAIKDIKDKKLNRLFIQAKLINLELSKNFNDEIWPVVREWVESHANYISTYNLKDHSFEELADQLSEVLRNTFSEELKLAKMSDKYQELKNSHDRNAFNRSSEEIKDLQEHIYTLIKHYDSLPTNVKTELSKCVLNDDDIKQKMEECEKKNQRSCVRLNPFLTSPKCPTGFAIDSFGNCAESCPEGFGPSNFGYCAKPQVEFVGAILGKIATDTSAKCPRNFTKIGLICVPRCPKNWEDHGSWCKRPLIKHNIEHDVLLIK